MTKKRKQRYWAEVLEKSQLSPHMVRVVFAGEGLAGFATGGLTDHYVKVEFPPPGAEYQAPYDLKEIKGSVPKKQRPRTRSYTVRKWDGERGRLTVDFFTHDERGLGGGWAVAASPGDRLHLKGPRGRYRLDPAAKWHLLVGDEAALPAIACTLAALPEGAPAVALVEVENEAEEIELTTSADLELIWIHREDHANADRLRKPSLLKAVRKLVIPAADPRAFIRGESKMVRAVRKHLVEERGLPRESVSASSYWKWKR